MNAEMLKQRAIKWGIITGIVLGIILCLAVWDYVKAQSTFGGWGGACTGTQATCQVLVNSSTTKTVTATFNLGSLTHYYVSPTGSDTTGNGTQAKPWATITHADSVINGSQAPLGSGGAVIHVADGTYSGIVSSGPCANFGFSNVNICVSQGGSSRLIRVILQCDGGLGGGIAARNHCQIRGGNYGFMVVTNNVDIIGFDIGNTAAMASGIISITSTQGTGVVAAQGNSVHQIGNYVHDLASTAVGPQGTGCPQTGAIGIGNHHGVIQQDYQAIANDIERFGVFPSATCNNSHGIYSSGAPNAIIQNNLIVGVPQAGVQITATCGNAISNNVVVNAKTGVDLSCGNGDCNSACPGGAPGANTVDNNILVDISGHKFFEGTGSVSPQCSSSKPNFWGNNITDNVGADWGSGQPYSCDAVSSTIHEAPTSTFVGYTTNGSGANYQLKVTSAGVNGGTTHCAAGSATPCVPAKDIQGVSRPQGSAYDIGVYEQ